jgi:predicted O-methyltransferase YrrM
MDFRQNPHIQAIGNILKSCGEFVEGNLICDIYPENYVIDRNLAKIQNLQTLASEKKHICEIGVNAGHSLLLMLLVNPTAKYTLFDLGNHGYTRPCVEYIKEQFPEAKIDIHYGSSVDTLPRYEGAPFDLCHLDGGHTEDVFSHDYANVSKLIEKNGTIIFDDYDLPAIRAFVDSKVSEGEIIEINDSRLIKTDLHFIYGI